MSLRSSTLLASLLFAIGCGGGGSSPDAGADATPDAPPADATPDTTPPRPDAGTELVTLQYTPDGCDYEVATPELLAVGMSDEAVGTEQPSPDHIHVSWAGPSHTSFAANWHTDEQTHLSQLLYGTDRAAVMGADGEATGVTLQLGHFMNFTGGGLLSAGTSAMGHEAHVCGLEPSTTYFYKVGGPGNWSAVLETQTAPAPGDREAFRFGVTGDARNNTDNVWPMTLAALNDQAIDFQVFSGDAVFLGIFQPDWDVYFGASEGDFNVQDLLSRSPLMSVNGNHEDLAINYVAQFAFPQEVSPGELGQGEEWYSFDYANAHFVMLNDTVEDDETLAGAQADWLRADLTAASADPNIDWIFATHHRAFYTCMSTHSPDSSLRAAWQPLFDEFGVDVVFMGHNHVYERSKPIRGLDADGEGIVAEAGSGGEPTVTDGAASGTIYLLAAGSGAPLYDVSDTCEFTEFASPVNNHAVVDIVGTTITITAYNTMAGTLLDEVTWTK